MLSTLLAVAALASKPLDFFANGPYDPTVPKPEAVLGYGPGEKHTTYRDQEKYILTLAGSATNRVKLFEYGKSVEGRPLRIVAVSSPANIARLDVIQKQHQELAEGKGDPSKTVPIVWINECIHGNETASFEAAMWTLYNLAATRGSTLAKALEKAVVIVNPVYNPDGHERYVVYNRSIATGSTDPDAFEDYEPSFVYGRTNHYRFDMNRDRVAFSQDETRQEFREFLRWMPQVYADQHGQVNSYFFPPEALSVNGNVGRERKDKWNGIFGRATAKAFDEHGFAYYTADFFDFYAPVYLDVSTTLSGAIGMTHETDGGRRLAEERPDGSLVTLRRGMEKHFTSALAVIQAAADNAGDLLKDFAAFKKDAVAGKLAGKFQRVVVTDTDMRPLVRLKDQLALAGVRSTLAASFRQDGGTDYWTGKKELVDLKTPSLVVDMAQPQGAYAKILLEASTSFEDKFVKDQIAKKKAVPEGETYPGPEGPTFYDTTGWALPYAYNLKAWWFDSASGLTESAVGAIVQPPAQSSIGYALPYSDIDDILATFDALTAGVHGMVTTKPMDVGGKHFDRGTFLFLADRNDDGFEKTLFQAAQKRKVSLVPLTSAYPDRGAASPGSESVMMLTKPNIALVMGNRQNLTSMGAAWYLFERVFQIPFTPIDGGAVSSGRLTRFSCVVLPGGASAPTSGKFKDWLSDRHVAVALDGIDWAIGSDKYVDLTKVKGDIQSLPGALFRAQLDPRSFLSYGYPSPESGQIAISVPVYGNDFYQVRKEGGSVIALSNEEKETKLLSGWTWPDDTEKNLRNTVWLQDVPVGGGHLVVFTQDPTDRAMWPGLYKLLLNAMLLGTAGG